MNDFTAEELEWAKDEIEFRADEDREIERGRLTWERACARRAMRRRKAHFSGAKIKKLITEVKMWSELDELSTSH